MQHLILFLPVLSVFFHAKHHYPSMKSNIFVILCGVYFKEVLYGGIYCVVMSPKSFHTSILHACLLWQYVNANVIILTTC